MAPRRPPPAQLPLDLALDPSFAREDFLVGPSNETAVDLIDLWPDWPERLIVLAGPEGSGKTHLAHVWAKTSGALIVPAIRLADRAPAELAGPPALVLEDCDSTPLDEARLFHLINLVREAGHSLLLTARRQPDLWGLTTRDLVSRLRLAPLGTIAAPDDQLLRALMVKHCLDRQLVVDTSVIEFLLPRIERSFAGVQHIVAALDRETLARGRRISRPVAAEVVARLFPG
ncbi:MAG: hypothetical protein LCH61_11820 [Proteobacteria bacterium]|nr:hypothetical protein [Pseudomonadota bacterium]